MSTFDDLLEEELKKRRKLSSRYIGSALTLNDYESGRSMNLPGSSLAPVWKSNPKPTSKKDDDDDIAPIATPTGVMQNKDFKEKSGYISTKSDKFWDKLSSKYGMGYTDLQYEYINNQNGIRDEIDSKASSWGSDSGKTTSSYAEKNLDQMTAEEVAVYNYYYQTQGKASAEKYLENIAERLAERKAGKTFSNLQGKTGKEIAYGIVAGAEQFKQGVKNLPELMWGDDKYIAKTAEQIVAGKVREDLADDGFSIFGNSIAQVGFDALQTGTNMIPSIAVGAANPIAGAALMGASAAGNAYQEDLNEFNDPEKAKIYATTVGTLEASLQYFLGGIGKLGGTSETISRAVSGIKNGALRFALEYGGKIGSEAFEEGLQEVLDPIVKNIVHGTDEEVDWNNVAYSSLLGGLMGGAFGSMEVSSEHLSDSENSVVNKEYKNRVTEAEQNGKKLTNKEKNKIFEEVISDMKKGYISTDLIEEVLGGDKYTAYKQSEDSITTLKDKQKAMQEEFSALGNKSNATLAEQARFNELRQQLKDIYNEINDPKSKKQLDALKQQLSKSVYDNLTVKVGKRTKGGFLLESYNEKARMGEDFKADFEKFKGAKYADAVKKTLENAIKAGANNTNRVHDIVDFAAKIAGDTGRAFDFQSDELIKADFVERQTKIIEKLERMANRNDAQNKKLAELKDQLEKVVSGKATVNGNITANGIVLNLSSAKPLNRIVGHEVTHIFEPEKGKQASDEYISLKDALYRFAKSKGVDIDKKLAEYEMLYEGIEGTTAEAEMIADMVGDYLFDDTDFAYHLSVQDQNVFQRVWNEIKHLAKIATAGSKEARELERVKKAFEEAYRKSSQAQKNTADGGVKLSLDNGNKRKYNKRSRYSEAETQFLIWENGSAPVGEVKKFVRYGKTHYYEKTENGCVELSRSQYNERTGVYVEKNYRRAEREISEADDYDASTQRGNVGHPNSNRDHGRTVSVFGQTFREELQHDSAGSVSSTLGYDSRIDIKQSEYNDEASDNSGASFTFSNDYATIRNFLKEDDAPVKYSLSDTDGRQLSEEQAEYFKDSKVRDENGNLMVLYHGTQNDFTVFDIGRSGENYEDGWSEYGEGIYLTPSKKSAEYYGDNAGWGREVKLMEVYADIKNPFNVNDPVAFDISDLTEKYELTEFDERHIKRAGDRLVSFLQYHKESVRDYLTSKGYDGVWEKGLSGEVYQVVAYAENQIKNTDNVKPTADPDIRFSLSERTYAEIQEEQQSLYQREREVTERKRQAENNPELLQAMDDYTNLFSEMRQLLPKRRDGTATQADLDRIEEIKVLRDEYLKRVSDIQENTGLNALAKEVEEIRKRKEELRVASDEAWAREGAEKENEAIARAGVSAQEYFRKKALKAFKTTTNFNEAGYLLPDGKLLNFSGGERNHRYRDHREIGEIYEATNGVAALNRFLSDGNIRIMAESPGADLASGVEPTREQYIALRKFINSHGTVEGQFFVDFSGEDGHRVGNYSYTGRVNADRVINDIKYFYQTGELREQSSVGQFLSISNGKEGFTPIRPNEFFGDKFLKEVAPVSEEVNTEVKTSNTEVKTEVKKATTTEELFPDDLAPMTEEEAAVWDDERLNSLTDADVPPERDAPYYGESEEVTADDPFANRDMHDVGNRKVKAYQYENPEVKPFFQEAAYGMLGDLNETVRGEKWFNSDVYYESGGEDGWGGTKRQTTDDIAELLDQWHYSYAEIEKGLNAIIEDDGKENNAVSKRIEFMLNDRLMNGYTTVWGEPMPANQEYISLLNEKQIMEYSDEARQSFWENADAYAPAEDIAPVVKQPKKTAPKKEYEAIGQQRPSAKKQPRMVRADTNAEQERIAQILNSEPTPENRKARAWAMFKANFLDKGAVFEDLSLKTKNRELMGKWNFILSSEARAQRLMGSGNAEAGVKSLNAIREEVENSGKSKEFYDYLYHKHNVDRMSLVQRNKDTVNKPVFGYSVTSEMSQRKVDQYEKANPVFKKYAKDVYDYMNYLRDLMVDNGVISQETADLWAEMYPHYVPIRRAGDTGLNVNVPLDTGRTGVNAPVKKATGGNRDILPLFDTMGQRTIQTFKAVAKNNFGVELKNTLGSTVENTATSVDEVIDSIDAQEGLLQEGKNGKSSTFTVFENGEKVTFAITKDMYDALKPVSEGLAYTNKILNTASNFHRGLLTEYNPVFMLTNAIKDAQDMLINSQHPAKTYAKIGEAFAQIRGKGYWYQEYMANGGEQNSYFDNQTNTFDTERKGLAKVLDTFPLKTISELNNFIEMTPRLAEYIASREAGRSIEVSMLDAARVTTNFQAGGDVTKFLNRNGATFLNASVQGFMQNVRNVREAWAAGKIGMANLITKFAIAGLPALLLNGLLWNDDEDYEELSDYVKQNYYVVYKYGDGQFVRIPKGRTMTVIQGAFDQVSNALTGNDEADFFSFLDLLASNLAPNNPIEDNIFAPIIQVANNKTWYGEDLVPTRLQNLPAAEQYDESTDAFSKWLGEKLNISPIKINYLLDQYSGGVGDTILPMLTPEAESGDNSIVGNLLAPLKSKFTTDSVMNNQNVSDFYDTKDKLTIKANASTATDKDVLMSKYMNSVNSELSDLYKRKREIQNSNVSDDVKYERVRRVQEQIVEMTKNALATYEKVAINGNYARVGDKYFKKDNGEWRKLTDEQATKYTVTSAAGNSSYATDGENHYRQDDDGDWIKVTDKQLEKQEEVTDILDIAPTEYWSNKEEYDYAYEHPDNYAVAKVVGGYESFMQFASELADIKANKDQYGKSIMGSRKEKVIEYFDTLDADYGAKLILFKKEYPADDTYNEEIIEYLNNREDISYEDMVTILKELGFHVSSDGTVTWD